jgi:hypothetical protein
MVENQGGKNEATENNKTYEKPENLINATKMLFLFS